MLRRIAPFVAAAVVAGSPIASAHIQIATPRQRDTAQKIGPCGASNSVRSQNVCTYRPGATIEVSWDETIDHPGHFRIGFDPDGSDDFVDPDGYDDVDGGPGVLVDNIGDRAVRGGDSTYTQTITLPNMECDNCTLQLIQVMTDKPPYGDGNDIYYQCADLVLSNAAPADPAESCAGGGDDGGDDDGGNDDGSGGGGDEGASGCAATGSPAGGLPVWMLALLVAVLLRARRGR